MTGAAARDANGDVIVVGGGPAGSTTALLLARAGYHVLLLERQEFPRPKACGDCLSPGANAVLRRLGVLEDVLRARPARLRGWHLAAPGGAHFAARFAEITPDDGAHYSIALRRDVFDAVLLSRARAAGVRVLHHVHVRELLRDRTGAVAGVRARNEEGIRDFRARVVVGADGLRSVIARRLGAYARPPRLRKTSFTLHTRMESKLQSGEMRLAPNACLGIAPIDDAPGGWHNITLVLNHGAFANRAGAKNILNAGLAAFGVQVHLNGDEILTSGPFDWPVRAVAFDGAALVGDAAGYYDPFTGQGIYQALAGAEALAENVGAALRNGPVTRLSLGGYERAHVSMRAAARRLQRIIEFICARPRLADLAFERCARNPAVARDLVGATGDLLPAESLFSARFLMRLLT